MEHPNIGLLNSLNKFKPYLKSYVTLLNVDFNLRLAAKYEDIRISFWAHKNIEGMALNQNNFLILFL